MSSVHIDGSGTRPLTFTMNDPARTSAQFSTKPDDDLSITLSGANGVLDMVVVPSLVEVERIEDGDYTRLRLRIIGGISGAVFTKLDPEGSTGWPHASIGARKDAPRQLADAASVQLGTLADLIPPAE